MQPEAPTITVILKRDQLKSLRDIISGYKQLMELCREQVELDIQTDALGVKLRAAAALYHGESKATSASSEQEPTPEEEPTREQRLITLLDERTKNVQYIEGSGEWALEDNCIDVWERGFEIRIRSDDPYVSGRQEVGNFMLIDLETGLVVMTRDEDACDDNILPFAFAINCYGRVAQTVPIEGPEECDDTILAHDLFDRLRGKAPAVAA